MWVYLAGAALVLVAFMATALSIGVWLSAPGHTGAASPNFDGSRFRNAESTARSQDKSALKWLLNRNRGPWEDRQTTPTTPTERENGPDIQVTFVNHATVLLQFDGLNVLTDPVWAKRASPFRFAGPRRYTAPGVRFTDLPPIDLVLLSHNHYDHLDTQTMGRLAREHDPIVVTGLGNKATLERLGVRRVVELDWWESTDIAGDGHRITAVPAQHFSGRGLLDGNKTLWCGLVIHSSGGPVYFAGDTGDGAFFDEIGERLGPIRLALLPIGAFVPQWFMSPVHISPGEAVEAARRCRARESLAIHHGTFALADDGQDEPLEILAACLATHDDPPSFWTLPEGGSRRCPPISAGTSG